MPLTVPMPFDAETLMDFDCGSSAIGGGAGMCSAWPSSPADYDADPLLVVSLPSDKGEDQGLLKDSSFGESDWKCKNYRRLNPSPRQQQKSTSTSSSSFQLWSPRVKQRDERKRVVKLSLAKLRRIDDTESCLGRYVLLSNTLRRLQREARDEKASAMDRLQQQHHHQHHQWLDNSGDVRLEHPAGPVAKSLLSADELPSLSEETGVVVDQNKPAPIKRRRSSEDEESLSFGDFYLPPPPTPRLISSLDAADDDVVDVVSEDDQPWCKRAKSADDAGDVAQRSRPALRPCNQVVASSAAPALVSGYASASVTSSSASSASSQPYSCGQSSLFGELQSVVFHSLITSLES